MFKKFLIRNRNYFSTKSDERAKLLRKGLPKRERIDGVKRIVAIASSKGGVGKSTVAVNVAIALKKLEPNKQIGLLDLDVFGPSVPYLMNLNDCGKPDVCRETNRMLPLENYGIKCMSIGFLIDTRQPVIWRGLMVMQAIQNLLRNVAWHQLDYLIVDTPPGTGDTQLSLVQNVPISGVVLVTQPNRLSQSILEKGRRMFSTLNVPIIGTVSNLDRFECPHCSQTVRSTIADNCGDYLVRIPYDFMDDSQPITISRPDSTIANLYGILAQRIIDFKLND